jgi:hypothetical protein
MNITKALKDEMLFRDDFAGDTWATWHAILRAAFGLELDEDQRARFDALAGGREPPSERVSEFWCLAGRRSGKTRMMSALAVYLSTVGAEPALSRLARGERGIVALIATDRAQSKVALQYVMGALESSPVLSKLIKRSDTESVELHNGATIQVMTASFRGVRGRSMLAAIFDECCFWRDQSSANPAEEIYRAVTPSLATCGGLLVGISSPYSRQGLVWSRYRQYFGQDSEHVLILQGASRLFNETIPEDLIERAYADDPESARSEWGGEFRSDVASFIDREQVERCVRSGPLELPYNRKHKYYGFCDAAGGGKDEYAYAVSHREGDKIIIDAVRARRGKPAEITAEAARFFKNYNVRSIQGDRYSGSWVSDEFSKHLITYRPVGLAKSDLYLECLPSINGEVIELPPDPKLIGQFSNLERRTSRAGKDSIDHGAGGNDDRCNAAAGAAWICKKPAFDTPISIGWAI